MTNIYLKIRQLFNKTPPYIKIDYSQHEKEVIKLIIISTLGSATDSELDQLLQQFSSSSEPWKNLVTFLNFAYEHNYVEKIITQYKINLSYE